MLALLIGLALAADDEPAWKRTGWGFGALPAVNYSSDEGLGFGALANLYRYDGKTSPYKVNVGLIVFATTRGIHGHRLDVDALDLMGGRLRFTGRLALDATTTNNFCGFGPDVTCDPAVAESEADARGLDGDAREQFVKRYYLSSYIRPNLFLNGRWNLGDLGRYKTELMTTVRVIYHQPGDFKNGEDADPGNLISHRLDAEKGLLPLAQVGVMFDTRDFESAPSRGTWSEVSVRGSAQPLGAFTHIGFNGTFRGYIPVADEVFVAATRLVVDGIAGDVPIREMANMGGSQIYTFGGGQRAGRGIRQRRYLGRVKGMAQQELRWRFLHAEPFGVDLKLTGIGFGDVLWIAEDWNTLDDLARPLPSFGGGLRIAAEDNFIIRVDAGFSEFEDYSPFIYIDLGHLY